MSDRGEIIVLASRVADLRRIGLLAEFEARPDLLRLRCGVCGESLLCFPDTLAVASGMARPLVVCNQCVDAAYERVPGTDPAMIAQARRFAAEVWSRLEAWP